MKESEGNEDVEKIDRSDPFNFHNCNSCVFRTKSLRAILSHIKKHQLGSESKPFFCEIANVEPLECQFCYFKAELKITLERHSNCVHKIGGHLQQQTEFKCYKCDKCNFETYALLLFVRHNCDKRTIDTSRRRKWFKCEECPKRIEQEETFNIDIHDRDVIEDENANCSSKPFSKEKKSHVSSEEKFECEYCSFSSRNKDSLKRHVLHLHFEDKIKWFECEECSFKTKRRYSLNNHIYNRHTPKEFKTLMNCEHCSYRTFNRDQFKRHMSLKHANK